MLFVLVSSVVGALLATASRASDPESGPPPTVEVQPHDTLWSIASRTFPGRSPVSVLAEIRQLNHMTDYTVHPGQLLILPRG
jgi:LysM repeat protein